MDTKVAKEVTKGTDKEKEIEKKAQEKVVKEMRQHHFDYGKDNPIYKSLNQEAFNKHNIADAWQMKNEASEHGNKQRNSKNIMFGNLHPSQRFLNAPDFSSTGTNFNTVKYGGGSDSQAISPAKLKENLRKSNIDFNSSRQGFFSPKSSDPSMLIVDVDERVTRMQ